MNNLFCNINVISQLKSGQKLYFIDDQFIIDNNNYGIINTFARWWYDENRNKTLEKIVILTNDTIKHAHNCINSQNGQSLENLKLREWELERDRVISKNNIEFLQFIISSLNKLIVGLNCLKDTYADDVTFSSKLDFQIQFINTNVFHFQKFLDEKK
jgi:hypothetical protein